jgi:hypothetical protein
LDEARAGLDRFHGSEDRYRRRRRGARSPSHRPPVQLPRRDSDESRDHEDHFPYHGFRRAVAPWGRPQRPRPTVAFAPRRRSASLPALVRSRLAPSSRAITTFSFSGSSLFRTTAPISCFEPAFRRSLDNLTQRLVPEDESLVARGIPARSRRTRWDALVEVLVRARIIEVADVFSKSVGEPPVVEDREVVEKLASHFAEIVRRAHSCSGLELRSG